MADVKQDKRTRERKADVATYERLGDISPVRVNHNPISQTNFGNSTEPSEDPRKGIGDALVDLGDEAPKPFLSLVEMQTSTPAGGLLHAGLVLTKCNDDYALVDEGTS